MAVKNMISVTRNSHMASLPLGKGNPMCACCGASCTAWVMPRFLDVCCRLLERRVQQQQGQNAGQIQQRRLQHPARARRRGGKQETDRRRQESEAQQPRADAVDWACPEP